MKILGIDLEEHPSLRLVKVPTAQGGVWTTPEMAAKMNPNVSLAEKTEATKIRVELFAQLRAYKRKMDERNEHPGI